LNRELIFFFVKRYLRFDREQPFISLSAGLAFLGIALGVMVLIIAMSIMNGFDKELQKKLSIMNYPLTVVSTHSRSVDDSTLQQLQQKFPEFQYSPYLATSIVVKYGREMKGGFLFGIDFERESALNPVIEESVKRIDKIGKFDVLIGARLQETLFIPKGTRATYIFTEVDPSGVVSTPKIKRFRVKGSFQSGLNSYDESYHYTSIVALQKILGLKETQYHGIHISTENPQEDMKRIAEALPDGYRVVGWWEQNGNLFSAIEMEKRALFIVLMLIILIASVNIISSLLMTVMNRRSEIALLISMGATEREVKRIFLYLGVVIGVSGVISGVGLGFLGLFVLENFNIISLPADIYGTSHLPLELSLLDFGSIVVGAFIIVVVSAIYPANRAGKIDIVQVLKNE
jgi:putative ABC transport system permease protein